MNSIAISVLSFLFVGISTLLIERKLIPLLSSKTKQPIYEEGPSWHLSKSGTPTMGGLAFIISITVCLITMSFILINAGRHALAGSLIISLIFCVGNSIIGIVDDLTKIKRKENAGLTPAQKLIFQFALSVIFLMARRRFLNDSTVISLADFKLDLGILYYPLAIILILGIINCANLTDGIDGLASSVALIIGGAFFIIGLNAPDVSILSSVLMGGACGFLIFNSNPARIFMGDTGSLFFGALVTCIAFSYGNPLIILPIGGVYVIEGVSVILQVTVFKLTHKRIFKMAPLHHHLEKSGVSEGQICAIAVFATLLLSSLVLLILEI
jgi:phospho-N-acetylmuramoyl-pentapeptide-transferase